MTTTITSLPTIPQRASSSTFPARVDALLNAFESEFQPDLNAWITDVNTSKTAIESHLSNTNSQASTSSTSQNSIKTNAQAAYTNAGISVWVSGTTYPTDTLVYSPLNLRMYRRISSGAGTTDPSIDFTNWEFTARELNLNLPSIQPSLRLNFFSGVLDSRVTFNRASSGTFINKKGLIELAAVNAPRFDYDPLTLVCKGLLIEESRTNLVLNSTIDGANLATQSVSSSATAYTLSFYGTGTVTLSGTYSGSLVGSGAYPTRSTLTFTPTAGTLTLTVTGTVQYCNLEAGSFATSYIPTAGSSVTRAADIASMAGTNFSSWYRQQEGTLVCEWAIQDTTSNTDSQHQIVRFTTNGINPVISVRMGYSTSRRLRYYAQDSGGTFEYTIDGASTSSTSGKFSLSWSSTNDFYVSENGAAVLSDTSGSITDFSNTDLQFGAGNGTLNGHIKYIVFYPKRLTNSELIATSTY